MKTIGKIFAGIIAAASMLFGAPSLAAAPKEIKLDYAYYSPLSLIIRKHGWLEEEFGKDGIAIKWVLSLGSNRALEYLNSGSSDFGSTSGISALVSRANGYPLKTVYIFNTQEASALLVPKDAPIRRIADLKGRKVAATKGTDPFFFLLRTLHANGLRKNDVEIVHLQHPDGRTALEQGRVDAWAGLDPHMAASELEAGSRVLYRNAAFSSYGFLNTTEEFIAKYPQHLQRVLKVYERARRWAIAHPDDTARIVADESKLSVPVIRQQLGRADFTQPVPGKFHLDSLYATIPILLDEELVKRGTDLHKITGELVDDRFARSVVHAAAH